MYIHMQQPREASSNEKVDRKPIFRLKIVIFNYLLIFTIIFCSRIRLPYRKQLQFLYHFSYSSNIYKVYLCEICKKFDKIFIKPQSTSKNDKQFFDLYWIFPGGFGSNFFFVSIQRIENYMLKISLIDSGTIVSFFSCKTMGTFPKISIEIGQNFIDFE